MDSSEAVVEALSEGPVVRRDVVIWQVYNPCRRATSSTDPAEHWLSASTCSFASTGQIRRTHGSSITCIRPQNQPRQSLQLPRPVRDDTAARYAREVKAEWGWSTAYL